MLLLASLKAYGPQRSEAYLPLPKWRRNAKRPLAWTLSANSGSKRSANLTNWLIYGSLLPDRSSNSPRSGLKNPV